MQRFSIVLAILCALAIAGCARINSHRAVEAAIQKHLRENQHLMLNKFTTRFQGVEVKGNTASAIVKYQSKEMPKLVVHVRYTLKLDRGEWQVVSSSTDAFDRSNPANPHSGATLDQSPPPQTMPGPIASH